MPPKPMPKRRPAPIFPILIMALGLILIVAAVFLFQSPQEPGAGNTPAVSDAGIPYPEIPRVSLADATAAYETGSAVFVDVRSESAYLDSHVAGSLSIPLEELPDRMNELGRDDWIITYCT